MTFTIPDVWCGIVGATLFWWVFFVVWALAAARKQKMP